MILLINRVEITGGCCVEFLGAYSASMHSLKTTKSPSRRRIVSETLYEFLEGFQEESLQVLQKKSLYKSLRDFLKIMELQNCAPGCTARSTQQRLLLSPYW